MKTLKLKRFFFGETYTIGRFFVDDEYFCDTLEDKVRVLKSAKDKIYGETAIQEGKYKVIVNMSPKFKRLLPRLLDVPYFEGILIHRGRIAKHTHGCILLGENKVKGEVLNGAYYELALVELLKDEKEIEITIE